MKIIYDITVLGLHGPHEEFKTGVYRVTEDLLTNLLRLDANYIAFSHTHFSFYSDYSNKYLEEHGLDPNLALVCSKRYSFLPSSLFGKGHRYFRYFFKLLGIDNDQDQVRFDVQEFETYSIFHSPFYPIPIELAKIKHLKTIITIYDLIPILFPKLHTLKEQIEKTIDSIGDGYAICISECTKRDLIKYNPKLDPKKIFVAMLAASPEIFYKCENEEKFRLVRETYNLPEKYFLSLSTLEPRKNIDHLIRSFIEFIKKYELNDLYLVLVGTKGWMFDKIFEESENAGDLKDRIIFTGRVPDLDLASIYSHAHSFYYMSLYEGFGLPPLEAMQCGVATVTSNSSSLPEVVGEGGITLDPTDVTGLVAAMKDLYFNHELRECYRQKALNQAKNFSWEICAKKHLEIYKQIAEN